MLLQMLLKDREEQRKKEEKQALMGTLAELQTMTGQGGHNLQSSSSGTYAGSGSFGGNN